MSDSENFAVLMPLIALITDPAAAQARLQELRATIEASDARKAEADASLAELARESDRLTKFAADLRAREVKVHQAEIKSAGDLEEIRKWKRDHANSRLVEVGSSGLTRERDDTENKPDPIYDNFAEPMGESRGGSMTHAATRVAHSGRARG